MMTDESKENLNKIIISLRGRELSRNSKILYASTVAGNPDREADFLKMLTEHPTATPMEIEKFLIKLLRRVNNDSQI